MLKRSFSLLLCAMWAAWASAVAADWPMFRGQPSLVGITDESLPDKLVSAWRFKTGGPVKSSPAIVGNVVFVGSTDSNVYALNLKDGKKAWATRTGGGVESSPLVLDGVVYIGSIDTFLYSLDASSVGW